MNYINLNHYLSSKFKPKINLTILTDLLESELDDNEIENILGLNLKDEKLLHSILNQKNFALFNKLKIECDRRKALLVILYTLNLEKRLKTVAYKALAYPILLFMFSFGMMLFVNGFLFKLFNSMLQFLGPKMDFSLYQNILNLFIFIDLLMLIILICVSILIEYQPKKFYFYIQSKIKNNLWSRIISYQFCDKFTYFYRLGGSTDQILKQIQWSSGPILNHICHQMHANFNEGKDLVNVIGLIDYDLQTYFKMNQEGIDIVKYLINHNKHQELMMTQKIKNFGKGTLMYSYITITFMIVIIYQVMLKPIEMMEQFL